MRTVQTAQKDALPRRMVSLLYA